MASTQPSNYAICNFAPAEPKPVLAETDEQQLLRLAREMIDVFISGETDHSFLSTHIACDFRGWNDLSATSMTVPEYQHLIRQIGLVHGERQSETVDEQVQFEDVDRHQAVVFQSVRYVAQAESLIRHAMRTSKWRRQNGVWLCFEQATFKNNPLVSGNIAPCFRSLTMRSLTRQLAPVAAQHEVYRKIRDQRLTGLSMCTQR